MGLMDFFIRPEPVSYGTAKGLNTLQINRIAADLRTARDKVNNQMAKRELLEKQREAAVKVKTEAEEQLGVFGLVQILLQKTSDYARQQVKVRIEDIVSEALKIAVATCFEIMARGETKQINPDTGNITEVAPPTGAVKTSTQYKAFDQFVIVREMLRAYKIAFEDQTSKTDRGVKFL